MDDRRSLKPREETAAEAFSRLDDRVAGLDGRIALMVRAVEHMAAERLNIEIPDYTPTLEKTNAWLAEIRKRLTAIEDAPALDMTPEDMGARIAAAAQKAREGDRACVQQVQQSQADVVQALHRIIGNARTQEEQRQHLLWSIGGGLLAGCLLWSLLPGMVVRAMPESWHWPERLAARVLRLDPWNAGERLLATADPEHWRDVVFANSLLRDNREAISACLGKARKAKKPAPCTVRINAGH